jgi:hypothetical protein
LNIYRGRALNEDHDMLLIESHPGWKHFAARALEWQNAAILMVWGAYLILHPGMFVDPRVATLWSGLRLIAAQETWGIVAFAVGFARLFALYVNGRHTRTPLIRLVASFFSAFVWTQVVLGMNNSGVPNTGLVVYTGLILADIYSAFRASADVTFVARQQQKVVESGSNVSSIGKRA